MRSSNFKLHQNFASGANEKTAHLEMNPKRIIVAILKFKHPYTQGTFVSKKTIFCITHMWLSNEKTAGKQFGDSLRGLELFSMSKSIIGYNPCSFFLLWKAIHGLKWVGEFYSAFQGFFVTKKSIFLYHPYVTFHLKKTAGK